MAFMIFLHAARGPTHYSNPVGVVMTPTAEPHPLAFDVAPARLPDRRLLGGNKFPIQHHEPLYD
jgi:hypothetical protein